MPRIPRFSRSRGLGSAAGSVNINSEGQAAQSRALERFGRDVEQIGLELIRRRKSAQDSTDALNGFQRFSIEGGRLTDDLVRTAPEDGGTIGEDASKELDELESRIIREQNMSPAATRAFRSKITNSKLGFKSGAERAQREKRAGFQIDSRNSSVDEFANASFDSPNLQRAELYLEELKETINGDVAEGLISPEQGKKFLDGASRNVSEITYQGFLNRRQYSAGLPSLRRNTGLSANLTPDQQVRLTNAFTAGQEREKRERAVRLSGQIKDFAARAQRTGDVSGKEVLTSKIVDAVESGAWNEERGKRAAITVAGSSLVARRLQSFPEATPEEVERLLEVSKSEIDQEIQGLDIFSGETPTFGESEFESVRAQLLSAVSRARKQQFADPVQFDIANSDGSSESPEILYAQATNLAQPNPEAYEVMARDRKARAQRTGVPLRLTTNQDRDQYIGMLNQESPDAVNESISLIQHMSGPEFPQVFSEIIEKDKSLAPLFLASNVNDAESRRQIISAVKNGKEIKKALSADEGAPKYVDLRRDVTDQLEPQFHALRISDPDGNTALINAYTDAIATTAADLITRKGLSQSDAVEQANGIFLRSYQVVEADDSSVLVPRTYDNIAFVEPYLESHLEERGLKQLGVPGNLIELATKQGKWITNETQTGVLLVSDGARGIQPIPDAQGRPIEALYEDITAGDEITLSHMRGRSRVMGVLGEQIRIQQQQLEEEQRQKVAGGTE